MTMLSSSVSCYDTESSPSLTDYILWCLPFSLENMKIDSLSAPQQILLLRRLLAKRTFV